MYVIDEVEYAFFYAVTQSDLVLFFPFQFYL